MPDVCQPLIAANQIHNGYVVISASPVTNAGQVIAPFRAPPPPFPNLSGQADLLETRLDDVRYYSGDTAA